MEEKLQGAVAQIMAMLAAGNYEQIVTLTHGVRLSAEEISGAIRDYGGKVIVPPDHAYGALDIVKVKVARDQYFVQMPLWMREEGMSDLTMELTVKILSGKMQIELNGIHIL